MINSREEQIREALHQFMEATGVSYAEVRYRAEDGFWWTEKLEMLRETVDAPWNKESK